jgi:hypothetical protein
VKGLWYGSETTPAQADVARALYGGGNEHLGASDDLKAP